jgi:NitT/TauT family transport system permease protein
MRRFVLPAVVGAASVAALIAAWQIYITVNPDYRFVISSPREVAETSADIWTTSAFWRDVLVTAREVLTGLVLGAACGLAVALLMMTFRSVARPVEVIVTGVNSIPKLALAPILIVWLGVGDTPKVVLMWLVVFIVFVLNLYPALTHVRREWQQWFHVLGATHVQRYRWLYLPSIVPSVFTSLRFSVGVGLRAVIFAEFLGAAAGLGYLITYYGNSLNMAGLMATLVAILALGLSLELVIGAVERRALRWRIAS